MPHSTSPEKSPHSENDNEVLPDAAPAEPASDTPKEDNDTPANEGGVKLEDMFNDDDEEFPASSAPDVKMESSPGPALG